MSRGETAALAAIGGKWKLIAQQLRELIGDGLVQRQPTGALLAPVEYSLTDYGRSILPLAEDVRLTAHEAT